MALHRPGPARVVPTATYRLQVHGGFTFEDAAAQVPYLAALGVSHVYLSPVLQAAPGSTHGYDVLDHTRVSEEAGGREAFDRLVAACREHDLGVVVDVVPNHMAVPSPEHLNAPFWSLLREGTRSPYAGWFDVDWLAEDERILMPVLGGTLEQVIDRGELVLADDGGPSGSEHVLRYYEHEFPVAPGTEQLPLAEVVDAQAYRLSSWREGDALNYRRFFDVTSLVAVRVEDPVVFTATHALLLALHGHGAVDGFRIDHPDGLADPGGYLERLAEATGRAWVVVEKILEGSEQLPDAWHCAGTTGYDALLRVQQVLTPSDDGGTLDRLWAQAAPDLVDLDAVVAESKRLVVDDVQAAEVDRLMRLARRVVPDADAAALRRALEALLVAMDRYRAYVVAGRAVDPEQAAVVDDAAARARGQLAPSDHDALDLVVRLVLDRELPEAATDSGRAADELRVRFQQTCGPVMAKGIEDTAFYRWFRLAGANEVGGDPRTLSLDVDGFHAWCTRQQAEWPTSMTTLTTHDTKRSEDTRARLMVLAEDAPGWERWLGQARELAAPHRTPRVDLPTEYLVWQTLVGTWPISGARLEEYLLKAVREAKVHTAWVDGDAEYEAEIVAFARALGRDLAVHEHLDAWTGPHEASVRANILGQKLLQLTMPGVPDVYQGCELGMLALVDPDNRRPVDWADRAERLARVDDDEPCFDLDDDKMRLTALALRLRREHPGAFVGDGATYTPVGCESGHALAFARGDAEGPRAVSVVTRAAGRLAEAGGFGPARVAVPPGEWHEVLSGRVLTVGAEGLALAELLAERPVALLVRPARQDPPPAPDDGAGGQPTGAATDGETTGAAADEPADDEVAGYPS
ncbi:malto-oligosyltrehalose synthase [Phycicoccus endophyticus]|uniref:Malto-oligosyltrehalose synthase n=1 Tax=Phycicoccus endophyticus TaxID=1690220 RepID=A0A7G9R3D1_9MICO|nr:malto-oligosyltrehalose synthase [Phycicoccus endophyticus]NHI19859.1 malto-oligosyltrehalose synthase [Phycicoccus endophyticus]QNN50106.1 malto-oligosyltrehalose synthase [Phycicoccus endophyticus]GGL27982.1 malto-oligosyltrehalose synthase [Phycicoccus endophyticus]